MAAAGLAGALLVANDVFFYESILVPSASMQPTILPNERIFLRHFPGRIKRFDVVVLAGQRFGERLAKRVVGLPGERVRLEDSWRLYINDVRLPYTSETMLHEWREANDHEICVGAGLGTTFVTRFGAADLLLGPDEYFVLGDNRLASDDSRSFGPVHSAEVQGTLGRIWYSYDRTERRVRTERLFQVLR
jgi:signal peptidase I